MDAFSDSYRFKNRQGMFQLCSPDRVLGIASKRTIDLRDEYYLSGKLFHVGSSLVESLSAEILEGAGMPIVYSRTTTRF